MTYRLINLSSTDLQDFVSRYRQSTLYNVTISADNIFQFGLAFAAFACSLRMSYLVYPIDLKSSYGVVHSFNRQTVSENMAVPFTLLTSAQDSKMNLVSKP